MLTCNLQIDTIVLIDKYMYGVAWASVGAAGDQDKTVVVIHGRVVVDTKK